MTNFFFDTEFIDTGENTHLISIGMVDEFGNEFYAELVDVEIPWDKADQWVLDNVKPLLHGPKSTRESLSESLGEFIRFGQSEGTGKAKFWAWCGAFDWVCLVHIFGPMVKQPSYFPYVHSELTQLWDTVALQQYVKDRHLTLPKQEGTKHDALEDARWNKKVYDYLISR